MKNEKMIVIYSNYGSKSVHIYRNVRDGFIELNNTKGRGLSLSWYTDIGGSKYPMWYHLKADESFQVFNYSERLYNNIEKNMKGEK